MKSFSTAALLCSLSLATLAACAKAPSSTSAVSGTPVVTGVSTQLVSTTRASANPDVAPTTTEVKVTAIVDKQALLSQQFLYGADLQYSSEYDKSMDLYQQSLSIGHVPAHFVIAGDELQLIADNERLYPSSVNHPDQLIARFKILSQTDTALTISGADSRVFLAEIFGTTNGGDGSSITDPTAKPARDLWIRSFEFAPKGNYLLQQTSVVLDDGTVAEFMESVFPRANLAPGKDFQKFEMIPGDDVGATDGPAARFRFLPGETEFQGEHKFAMAEHFDISKTDLNPEGTIDWYATSNITDEQIKPVKLAVEGWNRYFKQMKGIARDVVLFKGRLPDGVHLGDPRYNVINWDSRLVAGAAYETQAVDPSTGKQSHSMIYMPAAWLQIGFDYWKNGQYTEAASDSVAPAALARTGGAKQKARLACSRDLRAAAALLASGRMDNIEEFGNKLLKDTLFHEVGHALGLAHNFKGSLSFDRTDAQSMFSTSIMDYNDYEIELAAFSALDSADGPQLAYDRQAIDAIYNQGADIAASEPVIPTCNDAEADNEDGGVDPLCIRYDIEKDPTASIGTALDRIVLAKKPAATAGAASDVTMSESVARVPSLVLTAEALAAVKTQDDLQALAAKLAKGTGGAMQFYLLAGKASLARTIRLNVKSLLEFADDVLPDSYDEKAMRERVFAGVQAALALRALPAPVTAALTQVEKDAATALAQTPYMQGLAAADRSQASDTIAKALHKALFAVETDSATGLPKLRATVLASLARHPKASFFLGKLDGETQVTDYETAIVGILGDTVTAQGAAAAASKLERVTAATTLASFGANPLNEPAIKAVRDAISVSLRAAATNADRELAQALLAALKPVASATALR